MDNSTGNRRFNNGIIRIGNSLQTLCSIPNPCIDSTGEDFVNLFAPQDLTFGGTLTCTLKKTSLQDLVLTIKEVERLPGPDFKVVAQAPSPVNLADYNGGSISVAGGPWCISCLQTFNGNNVSFVVLNTSGKSNFIVPLQIFDDDDIPFTGPSSRISDISFSDSEVAFAEAYIDVKNDGGGKSGNNQTIDFDRNVDAPSGILDIYSQQKISDYYTNYAQSKTYERSSYWVVYVLSAWQYRTDLDADPISTEENLLAATVDPYGSLDCSITRGGTITAIFHESIREASDSPSSILVHELGHQCCLTHGNQDSNGGVCASCLISSNCPNDMGIMTGQTHQNQC